MSSRRANETPMMQQYWKFRDEIPEDTLLLFRLGDFYEMFYQDAEEGSRILGITLTKRQNYPMAGIPYHAADNYIPKLLAAGRKVAIVDQVEAPRPGKIVKRALSRILTPGTTLDEHQLDARRNNFLLAVHSDKHGFHASWLDLSTGDFHLASDEDPEQLLPLFHSLDPREIILPEAASTAWAHEANLSEWYESFDQFQTGRPSTLLPDYLFSPDEGKERVIQTLKVHSLDGFGIQRNHPALGAAGALLHYATENLCSPPENLRRIREYRSQSTLLLDLATQRNLEIFKSAQNSREGSLLAAMDRTVTAAGARLLESFLSSPLQDLDEISRRQLCVGAFLEQPGLCHEIQNALKGIRDIPRILGRLQNRIRNPRELGGIRDTLTQLPSIRQSLDGFQETPVATLAARIHDFTALSELLDRALNHEMPSKLQDGGVIADGYDKELDRLRSLTRDNKTWIADLEKQEQSATGIKNLKVKFNGSFGYFIEVTKSNLSLVPDHYIRRQTTVNAERFVTESLREKEKEIFHAEENAIAHEEALFRDLVETVLKQGDPLTETAAALAEIDLFIGWATLAREWDYGCPILDESDILSIDQGRHPVVEQMLKLERRAFSSGHSFVPNDTGLSAGEAQIALITGPNMAGKSTYIRQVALIALMAQVGSWVPAKHCHIGLVDRIFSRVGASDELARGNSTFMVEMNETANILNNASPRSLIILDEIGRGTSTYDGLSIAWAVIEYLHGDADKGPRTLFATHYHEVTQLEKSLPRLRNFSVSVKEWNDDIIFVRQVIPGAADRSYGIQVARLAGLPASVISRAKVILEELESEGNILQESLHDNTRGSPPTRPVSAIKKTSSAKSASTPATTGQMELF